MKVLILSLITTISLLTSGCAQQPTKVQYVYLPVPLEHDARPEFPKLKSSELLCLSDETKNTLTKRDKIMKNYIDQLETIIDTTKK